MQVFKPTHYNYVIKSGVPGLYIESNNHIIITKKNYRYTYRYNYKSMNVYTQTFYNLDVCFGHYDPEYIGDAIRNQLNHINNEISVCYVFYSFVILLDSGKLVYIIQDSMFEKFVKINKMLEFINIEYISNTDNKLIIFSENKLYVIDIGCNITMYDDVIGYLVSDKTVLILYDNFGVGYHADNTLYLLNSKYDLECIQCNDILKGLEPNLIEYINILNSEIYIRIDSMVKCYVYLDAIVEPMMFNLDAIQMYIKINVNFWYSNDNVLSFKSQKANSEVESCMDVIKYLFIIDFLVCIHSDSTVTVIQYKVPKIDRDIYNGLNQNLYTFLTDPKNFEVVNRIDKIIDYELIDTEIILIYLTIDEFLEFYNIETLEFVILNKFLTVESDFARLPLLRYPTGSYI